MYSTALCKTVIVLSLLKLSSCQNLLGNIIDNSGARDASIEDCPYQVLLKIYNQYICGGSIISETEILTAAHCIPRKPSANLIVFVGSSKLFYGIRYRVKSASIHKKYNTTNLEYDIAIISLAKALKFGSRVRSIKLAEERSSDQALANITGWGSTSKRFNKPSLHLKVLTVETINQETCNSWYKRLTDRMICAGFEEGGKDACFGDSGGPLIDVVTGKQIGIISNGNDCAKPKSPAVYTSIPDVVNFKDIHQGFKQKH